MEITKAKDYVNQSVQLSWTDRKGHLVSESVFVYEVNFVPFYGPCFITSHGDIRLDRVIDCFARAAEAA